MIIFDLDGTLADCEHRRHFVDHKKHKNLVQGWTSKHDRLHWFDKNTLEKWYPDWKAFYEACDKDLPIESVVDVLESLHNKNPFEIQIWSGRCESVRDKTCEWIDEYLGFMWGYNDVMDEKRYQNELKMRPIGDSTPDEILKEKWLDEALSEGKKIDFVFDDKESCCNMWNKRHIMCFLIKGAHGYTKNN